MNHCNLSKFQADWAETSPALELEFMAFRLLFLPFLVAMVVAEAETCDSDIRMAMETETVESLELLQVKAKDKTEDAEAGFSVFFLN